MLLGEASSAQSMMDTLLESPDIFAINLWRPSGEVAFRDNKTIDYISKLTESDVFSRRKALPAIHIPDGERSKTFKSIVKTQQDGQVTLGEIKNDEGVSEPVEYAYYLLKNEDACQTCHGDPKGPIGVLEVAVSRATLLRLEKESADKLASMKALQDSERAKLAETNSASTSSVKTQTEILTSDIGQGQTRVYEAQSSALTMSIVSKIGFFAITIVVLFLVMNKLLTKPIHAMANAMRALAEGNKTIEIPGVGTEDEIGLMAKAVQVFKDSIIKADELSLQQAEARKSREQRTQHVEEISQTFNENVGNMLEKVSTASTQLQSTARSMSTTADQTSTQAGNVSSAAELASANVQTVASAAEELSSSISEISRQVVQSSQITKDAVQEVEGANAKVLSLAEAAQTIGDVVALITDIADQTNLLALNATIEAARAGEAGKGFAVVASEVKNLANQTARATEEISNQIKGIQGATHEAVDAIGSIGGIINKIDEITSAIAAAVEEQGAATQEIARNVIQASNGTQEVSTNIINVTQAAAETGQSSNEVLNAAAELSQHAETLRQEVDTFLNDIKKA
jgi:methyl-accepting chemotaxis protein